MDFQPVLLGSEIGVYGMARAFHSEFGVTSRIVGRMQLSATKFSRIVEPFFEQDLTDPKTFVATLTRLGERMREQRPDVMPLLIPCGDDYSELLSRSKDELKDLFAFNAVDADLHDRLSYKASFYEYCDRYDLPHPDTVVLSPADAAAGAHRHLPFGFPVALKPSDSVAYLSVDFEGRKKAYIINSQEELDAVVAKIFAAGYDRDLICQDFIPGGDENMRVLNAYVDRHHRVRMMYLGNVVLGDPTPYAIGNYAAIIPDYNEPLCLKIKRFLEDIGYVGVANFDMKYDPRDGEYKLFEINLRQGRTNFVASLNGYNLARYYVDDLIRDTPFDGDTVIGRGSKMLLEVPPSVLRKYARPGEQKDRAMALLANGDWQWTLDYTADHSPLRRLLLWHLKRLTVRNYDTYMPQEEAERQ